MPEGRRGYHLRGKLGESIFSGVHNRYKGPEVEMSLVYLKNEMGADVAARNTEEVMPPSGGGRGRETGGDEIFSKTHREPWEALEQERDGV